MTSWWSWHNGWRKVRCSKQIQDRQPKGVYTCLKLILFWLKPSSKQSHSKKKKTVYQHGIQCDSSYTSKGVHHTIDQQYWWKQFSMHPFLDEMCEIIIFGNTCSEFDTYKHSWSPDDKRTALALLLHLSLLKTIHMFCSTFAKKLQSNIYYHDSHNSVSKRCKSSVPLTLLKEPC